MDPQRRGVLLQAKLRGLVRSRWHEAADRASLVAFPGGAAASDGGTGWVLAVDDPRRGLGGALALAIREGLGDVHVFVDDPGAAGVLARRAEWFDPPPRVWSVDGAGLVPADAAAVEPEPAMPAEMVPLVDVIEASGARAVWEHGVLRAEVRGLEVGRVVVGDGGPVLEVGVGKHDRWAHAEIGSTDLARVVREVREARIPGNEGHPATQHARERWLREAAASDPSMVGVDGPLEFRASPSRREDLRVAAPAPARAGDRLLVCSVGVDIDVVPGAIDAWLAEPEPRPALVVVVPDGDDHAVTRRLVDALRPELRAEIRTVPKDWNTRLRD